MTTTIALFLGIATGLAALVSMAARKPQPVRAKQPAGQPSQGKT